MANDTTLLLGLDGLAAERVEVDTEGYPVVHLVTADPDAARCPACQMVSTSPKQQRTTHPRDLAHGGRGIKLLWHKRRWRCRNPDCVRRTFTEQVASVPARSRITTRLRARAGAAVADQGATVVQAGRDLGLSQGHVVNVRAALSRGVSVRDMATGLFDDLGSTKSPIMRSPVGGPVCHHQEDHGSCGSVCSRAFG